MKKFALLIGTFFCFSILSSASHAISGNEQVELAGSGRFEELWRKLEQAAERQVLKTPDLHALCFAYSKTKRYNKLMPCLDHLDKLIAQGDKRTRLFGLDDATATVHLMRGEALVELGQYSNAIDEAKKALAWYKRTESDDKDIEIHALTVQSLASAFGANRVEAEKYAKELEQVSTSWPRYGDFATAKSLALAKVNMALARWQQTYDAIASDKAFAVHAFLDKLVSGAFLTGKNNWAWQELPRSFMLNKALFGMGRFNEAKEGYDQLLKIPQVKDNGEIYWLILFDRGQIAERENKLEEAVDFYKKAIEVIEYQRTSINTEANKIGFIGDKQQVYGKIINALFSRNDATGAFSYIERAKSRALVDILASKQATSFVPKARSNAFSLKDLQDAEIEVLAQDPISAAEGKQAQRELRAKVVEQIKVLAPELNSLISVTSLPIEELRKLIGEDEVIVQYYYQDGSFFGLVVSRTNLQTVKLDFNQLEGDVRKLRDSISQQAPTTVKHAQALYQRLLKPVESMIEKKNVLIVPHGILHYLPFAALHDGKQYFIEKHAFRILPNASVLKYLRQPRGGKLDSILVFGNPDLGDASMDLPSAQAEAQDIAKRVPNSKLLLRKDASKTAFKNFSKNYRLLHFASHGTFDSASPLNSGLLLAKDGGGIGLLTVDEIYSTELDADLVTLSACETGLGKISNGDDVIGLTRGFLFSGASTVIASLWQVDDAATADLMIQFYEALGKRNKRDALRAAQLNTMKRFPHPFFWSAFYLTGNMS